MIAALIPRLRGHLMTIGFLVILTLIIAAVNVYGLMAGVSVVLPHLFYIPIILAAFFYPHRGVLFAGAVSMVYLLMVAVVHPGANPDLLPAFARVIVFITIAAVVSYLSEQVSIREAELRHKKEEWERTFDAVPDLIALIDRDHGILRVNRAMADRLGISPDEAVGRRCFEVVHGTSAGPLHCPHAALLRDGKVHTEEIHEEHLGGDFLVTTSPLSDADGLLIGSVHIARDITERKLMEEALRESEEKYRTLVESSFDGIAIHQNGVLVYVNRTAARILGSDDPEDFIGKSAIDMVAPVFREQIADRVRQASEKTLGLVRERFLRLDGSLIDVDVATAPAIWKGHPAAYVTFRDITAQVRAEEALRESEERYRTIIENIQDVYFRFNRESRLVMVSPSAAPVFGYMYPEELLGVSARSIWKNPEARERMIATMREQGGFVHDWETEFIKSDGTSFWASVSGRLHTDENGEYNGTEGIIRDISQRKQTEDALKTALNKLNMLSSITRHDILNQITGLRTFLELSREELKGTRFEPLIEKADWAAEAIQRQIEFTRYYQDIGVNAPRWQDAEAVIREAVAQLSLPAIDVKVAISGIEVFADPLIVKVFFNLMENSLRHGGTVTQVSFESRKFGAGLIITYRDNGVGISPGDKAKLFQRGFGKHTGLGLFLSREILAITGITITENGEPGRGVQFEITVPAEAFRFRS